VNHEGDLIDTAEMYLRTLLELEEEGVVALRARIAERIGHTVPSVSQTIARMEREGQVTVTATRRLRLTRCRRKTLTIHKSGFQPLYSPSTPFFLSAKATLAARRPMRSSVLPPSWRRPCRLISAVSLLTAAASPRLPARGIAYLPMPGALALSA
jgi:Iron dependent repressor, N-terminal DNA binding domain